MPCVNKLQLCAIKLIFGLISPHLVVHKDHIILIYSLLQENSLVFLEQMLQAHNNSKETNFETNVICFLLETNHSSNSKAYD